MASLDTPPIGTPTIKWRVPDMHPEGRKYVFISGVITVVAYLWAGWFLTWPLRAASLAWWGAETGWLAPLGVGFSARVPRLLRWLMNATRLDGSGSLAQVPAHP